jgi:hypothetical protein
MMSKRSADQSKKLKNTIVRMALYDGTEVEPNVFRTLTLAEIGRALWVSREYVRQVLEARKTNLSMLKRGAAYRERLYRAALKANWFRPGKQPREYRIYHNMLNRCFNKNHPNFANYGGRGVTVCNRWLGKFGFQNFMQDFGRSNPNDKRKRALRSINRIDNVLIYSPSTVEWATQKKQCAAGQRRLPKRRSR